MFDNFIGGSARALPPEMLKYAIGGLLYAPAGHVGMRRDLFKYRSVAMCLEDSILDKGLAEAENGLAITLRGLVEMERDKLPLIFVRVRSCRHMKHIHTMLGGLTDVLTGYILPKFSSAVAFEYMEQAQKLPQHMSVMPILESGKTIDIRFRHNELFKIKDAVDSCKDRVLNVRVGGNDFCRCFGLRRGVNNTIYDIGVIASVLYDIINVFSTDYVVSGPVWEYFGSAPAFKREIELDRLNGFIGKTAVHPSQLESIEQGLAVSSEDFSDAQSVLDWNHEEGVAKGEGRMNELSVHKSWAIKTLILAKIYGVRN